MITPAEEDSWGPILNMSSLHHLAISLLNADLDWEDGGYQEGWQDKDKFHVGISCWSVVPFGVMTFTGVKLFL